MSQHMRAHALVLQRRAFVRGRQDILVKQVMAAVCAKPAAARIWEQWLILGPWRLSNPRGQYGAGALAQWRATLLAPLAKHAYMRAGANVQVLAPKAGQLRQA